MFMVRLIMPISSNTLGDNRQTTKLLSNKDILDMFDFSSDMAWIAKHCKFKNK